MPPEDDKLARFQATLLKLLGEGLSAEATMHRLQTDAAFAPYRDYVASFEPRMVEVAAWLVAKWGVRSDAAEPVDGQG